MSEAIVTLKKGEGRTIKAGGMWIFDNEIDSILGTFENGDIVTIHDFDGYFMGYGFINTKSKITVRLMSRRRENRVTEELIEQRVRAAWEYRKQTIDTSCCRVIFGEADFLPGLVIDKYEDILVVQISAYGMDQRKNEIIAAMVQILEQDGIRVRGIYERSDGKYRAQEGLPICKGFLSEAFDTKVPIQENGVRYLVDVAEGQKTGFFLDQKNNRMAVQKLCRDAEALDLFTHTGSFALNAIAGGARKVLGIDASKTAIEQAQANALLNPSQAEVHFEVADILEILPQMAANGLQYDVVIVDPPAFAKSKASLKNALKGYREVNTQAMRLVRRGGFLASCSCSQFVTYDLFTQMLQQSARAAHRTLRQVYYATQAPDHPILWSAGESYYLKFYIFQVI